MSPASLTIEPSSGIQVNKIKLKREYADYFERIENEKNIQCDFNGQTDEDSYRKVINIEGH